jgi:hypothetical protein
MTLEEISHVFPQAVVYHIPSSFKTIKTISNVVDSAKPMDSFKSPSILYVPEEPMGIDSGILIMLSTFGKIFHQTNTSMTNLFVEEYSWKNPGSREPVLRLTSNGVNSTFLNPSGG